MEIAQRIGKNMQIARKKAGLLQKEVAHEIGVTTITLSRWENGTRQPSLEKLEAFAKIVGRPIYGLFRDNTKRKTRRFKKYYYEKEMNGKMAFTYKIIELGKKDSDPLYKNPGHLRKSQLLPPGHFLQNHSDRHLPHLLGFVLSVPDR